ncbi:MAG: hypothetical protein ACT4OK_18155 [Gemmobacter sp.]
MASEIEDLQRQIDDVLNVVRFNQKSNSEYMSVIRDESFKFRKDDDERLKSLEKETADLKSRVKDLEAKLGKMGKK